MLILTRRVGEKIIIGDNIVVANLGVNGNQVRFGIEAPKDVQILRENAISRNKKENKARK